MSPSERDTYLPIHELLDRAVEYAASIDQRLEELRGEPDDSRVALLQHALRDEQLKLTTAIERYVEEAPDDVMETVAQYAMALPEPLPALGAKHTTDELERWAREVNGALRDYFAEIAEVSEETPAREPFENLAALVRAHEKRIVQAFDGTREL